MSGPGEPSRGPVGWRPCPTSAGRSSVQAGGTWSGDSHGTRARSFTGTGTYSGAAMEQGIHDRVRQGLPRRLDDVLADADRAPGPLAVGRIEEDARDRAGAGGTVEDAHLEVHQAHVLQLRVPRRDGGAQGAVDGVHRPVALG